MNPELMLSLSGCVQPAQRCITAGNWAIKTGQALTLHPRTAGVLRVRAGRIWLTQDGPHAHGAGQAAGDQFLESGASVCLLPGQRVVLEAWPQAAGCGTWFAWDPKPSCASLGVAQLWQQGVQEPLQELGRAVVPVAQALGRLAWGLGRLVSMAPQWVPLAIKRIAT